MHFCISVCAAQGVLRCSETRILHCINTGRPAGHKTASRSVRRRNTTVIKTLTSKFTTWRRFRESVRELSRLSDRELNDLGIGRSDIVSVVKHSLQG